MAFNDNDLADIILSTLNEMENDISKPSKITPTIKTDESRTSQLRIIKEGDKNPTTPNHKKTTQVKKLPKKNKLIPIVTTNISGREINTKTQTEFLSEIREKMLVLFTGLQSEQLVNKEAKMDLVLNYLEYTLASIDERIEKL